jgi:hypothetical protein
MKGTVNPFEPWRPVEGRIPPPLYASRPWRPPLPRPVSANVEEPPLVEPIKPQPRNKLQAVPRRQQAEKKASPPKRMCLSKWLAFVVLGVAGILCLDSVGWYRSTHIPRLAVLGVSAGILAGMAFSRRRSWYRRLSWMAAALAIAGIAMWFIPTTQGVSLWAAYRQIEAVRALPAGDVSGYQRGEAARRTLVKEYPSFAAVVREVEQAWLRRTVDEAIENSDRQLDKNPDTALAQLRQLHKELSRLEHYATVKKELEAARRRAVQACIKVAQQP